LKNEIENIKSNHINKIGFPDIFLFQPKVVISVNQNIATIASVDDAPENIFKILNSNSFLPHPASVLNKTIQAGITRKEYLKTIDQLKKHIGRGDCYEINFCQEFFIEDATIDACAVYMNLLHISPSAL